MPAPGATQERLLDAPLGMAAVAVPDLRVVICGGGVIGAACAYYQPRQVSGM